MDTTRNDRQHDAHLTRRVVVAAWSGVRQLAGGIDAGSRIRHGMDVPSDHVARRRPQR